MLEYPDEEWIKRALDPEVTFEPRVWHGFYFQAFDALQYERNFGGMGSPAPLIGPLSYMALSRYADDIGLSGEMLDRFHIFMNSMDAEWIKHHLALVSTEKSNPKPDKVS